jgi:hypothetical protein
VAKFLEQLVPDIQYIEYSKRSKSTTIAPNGLRPGRIQKWVKFIPEARRYDLNCTKYFHAPKLEHNLRARNEAAVDIAFNTNVISNVRTFFDTAFPRRIFFEPQVAVRGGRPDHCMLANDKVFFFSETKTKWNIASSYLVKDYRKDLKKMLKDGTPSALVNAVDQVFGYLGGGKLQFGAMSTYDYTWFLKRPKDSPGCLQVSDRIAHSSIGPSVLKC